MPLELTAGSVTSLRRWAATAGRTDGGIGEGRLRILWPWHSYNLPKDGEDDRKMDSAGCSWWTALHVLLLPLGS